MDITQQCIEFLGKLWLHTLDKGRILVFKFKNNRNYACTLQNNRNKADYRKPALRLT